MHLLKNRSITHSVNCNPIMLNSLLASKALKRKLEMFIPPGMKKSTPTPKKKSKCIYNPGRTKATWYVAVVRAIERPLTVHPELRNRFLGVFIFKRDSITKVTLRRALGSADSRKAL